MTNLPRPHPDEDDEAASERSPDEAAHPEPRPEQESIGSPSGPVEHARFLLAAKEPADGLPIDPDEERRRVKKLLFDAQREARRLGIPTADDRQLPVYEPAGTLAQEIKREAVSPMEAANRRADVEYAKYKETRPDGSTVEATRLRVNVLSKLLGAIRNLASLANVRLRRKLVLGGKVGNFPFEIKAESEVEMQSGESGGASGEQSESGE